MKTITVLSITVTLLAYGAVAQSNTPLIDQIHSNLDPLANLAQESWIDTTIDCGVKAVSAMMMVYGIQPDYHKIKLALFPESKGTSLARLERYLQSQGLYTSTVYLNLEQLCDLRYPAILHARSSVKAEEPDHYLIILGVDADKRFLIVNPGIKNIWLNQEELRPFWDGVALVVARKNIGNYDILEGNSLANRIPLAVTAAAAVVCLSLAWSLIQCRRKAAKE